MNLTLDLKSLLPILKKLQPYAFGLALIGVFGYTAWVVNAAVNVKAPEEAGSTGTVTPVKIKFDKATIETVKNLDVVGGNVSTGDLGKDDPFK